jgi:diacylglycerol kinase
MICCVVFLTLCLGPALVRRILGQDPQASMLWRLHGPADPVTAERRLTKFLRIMRERRRAFTFAGQGFWHMARHEPACWVHGLATSCVVATALLLKISADDWRWLAVAIAAVWTAEALNTAIESCCDAVTTDHNEHVRIAKDVGASAALISSVAAVVIGAFTFWPYLSSVGRAICNALPIVLP